MTQYVYGKNVVKQVLLEHKKVYEVLIVDSLGDKEIKSILQNSDIPWHSISKKRMDQIADTQNHQGIVAKIDDYKTYAISEILQQIPAHKTPLLVMLDSLEDPHNLGAILRTCDCVGVDGVIIAKHRSVRLTPSVAKVSTGAIDTIKVAVVTNLVQALVELKKQGFWVVGADMDQSIDYRKASYDMPLVLVIGSEGFGIRPLVKKNCDYCIRIPMEGCVSSLNASVACGVLLYQIYTQRNPL